MAIVKDGSKTGLSGKAEGMVYVQLNGQTIMRKLPRHKKDSPTPGMLLNQERFRKVNSFCALFKDSVIPQIWNGADQKMSGYSLFLKTNVGAFEKDGSLMDAGKIKLSIGKLPFPEGMEVKRSVEKENLIEVNWPKEMHVGGVHMKDELMLVSGGDGEYSDITSTGITKADLHGSFELPDLEIKATHIYLFFATRERRDFSESRCFEV